MLEIDPPLEGAVQGYTVAGADFALVLMAVNVGPVDDVYIDGVHPGGVPGGYILARDGLGLPTRR